MEISKFKNILQSSAGEVTSIDHFLNEIKFGTFKDICQSVRQEENKKKRNELKKKLPYVTISGLFNDRKNSGLIKHSGFICLDFDDVGDVQKVKETISQDHFVHSCFVSASGNGLAALVKINPKKHLDAFLGLEVYFSEKYDLQIDRACKDVCRPRFATYDEQLYVNQESQKFEKYIKKELIIPKNKIPDVITSDNDLDFIVSQINRSKIDITNGEYIIFRDIGFAISSKFGESGRDYFHDVCNKSFKYDQDACNLQYDKCLKATGHGITIGTFLYYCRQANIEIVSTQTKHIVSVAAMQKKAGNDEKDAANILKEIDGIDESKSLPLIKEVFDRADNGAGTTLTKIESLELFLNHNFNLKRNEITRFIENNGKEIDSSFVNSIYFKARKEVEDKIKFEEIDRLINSEFTEDYNPVKDFIHRNSGREVVGNIEKLTKTLTSDDKKSEYLKVFLTKWLVGMIASINGKHSPLLLVLTGPQNAGKTAWFRQILPAELQHYYAESKLDAGKDDEILMTQKLLILDDEFGGKNKTETKRLKELTSKEYFTLREPYGRKNVRIRRLSILAGTSNERQVLNDPTGNRRVIPFEVEGVNWEIFNSIDKIDLFIEASKLYEDGYKWELSKDDIKLLNSSTDSFEQVVAEREMLLKYYALPASSNAGRVAFYSITEIKAHLEQSSGQKLNQFKLMMEVQGFAKNSERKDMMTTYELKRIENSVIPEGMSFEVRS